MFARGGGIWAESPGDDEERLPGTQFHMLLPLTIDKVDKSHLPQCHTCLWINLSDPNLARCTRHILIILDATASLCSDFHNDSISQFALNKTNLDSGSLYQWIENPITAQLELAALASFDYIRSWSIAEQHSMRAKRVQLRQFFKRSKI